LTLLCNEHETVGRQRCRRCTLQRRPPIYRSPESKHQVSHGVWTLGLLMQGSWAVPTGFAVHDGLVVAVLNRWKNGWTRRRIYSSATSRCFLGGRPPSIQRRTSDRDGSGRDLGRSDRITESLRIGGIVVSQRERANAEDVGVPRLQNTCWHRVRCGLDVTDIECRDARDGSASPAAANLRFADKNLISHCVRRTTGASCRCVPVQRRS